MVRNPNCTPVSVYMSHGDSLEAPEARVRDWDIWVRPTSAAAAEQSPLGCWARERHMQPG